MSRPVTPVRQLVARLHEEGDLAPPAALASNVAQHYDRNTAALIYSGDAAVIPAMLALLPDTRPVRREQPPHLPLDGGYGKTFGPITVGDKARFVLGSLLPEPLFKDALAGGARWYEDRGKALKWDAAAKRFTL